MRQFLLLILIPLLSFAGKSTPSVSELNLKDFPGIYLVAKPTKTTIHAFGTTDRSNKRFIDSSTQFLICSLTKQFTAVAVIKLLYERQNPKFRPSNKEEIVRFIQEQLHAPISKILNCNDPIWEGKAPDWIDHITLHQLLTHTSGVPDPSYEESFELKHLTNEDPSRLKLVSLFKEKKLDFQPGGQWKYSNSGYLLIGFIIERLSGMDLNQAFETLLFKPSEMSSTHLIVDGRFDTLRNRFPDLAMGHGWNLFAETLQLQEQNLFVNMTYPWSAGGVISTVEDLHKWNLALFKSNKILPSSITKMITQEHVQVKKDLFYGYGIGIRAGNYPLRYEHSGSIPGFKSGLYYYPDDDISVVWLTNVSERPEQVLEIKQNLNKQLSDISDPKKKAIFEKEFINKEYPFFLKHKGQFEVDKTLLQEIDAELQNTSYK